MDGRQQHHCGQCFEMVVGHPGFAFETHLFGFEEESVDDS